MSSKAKYLSLLIMAVLDTAIATKKMPASSAGMMTLCVRAVLAPFQFLMRGHQPQPFGFPDGINREGQAGQMAQLAASEANILQLKIVEAVEFEELFAAAPIADELAQG